MELNILPKNALILDMSYNKNSTRNYFGLKVIDGYTILVEQAIEQFKIWTKIKESFEKSKECRKIYYHNINEFISL